MKMSGFKHVTRCWLYLSGSHKLPEQVHLDGRRALAGTLRHFEQSSHWTHWIFSLTQRDTKKIKMKEIRLCWLGVKQFSQSTSTKKYSKILRQTKRKELITQSQYRMKRRENEAWFMVVNQMTANTHYNRDLFPNSTDVFLMVMLLTDTYIQSLWWKEFKFFMLALLLNPGISLSQPRKAMSKIHNFGMLVKIFISNECYSRLYQ